MFSKGARVYTLASGCAQQYGIFGGGERGQGISIFAIYSDFQNMFRLNILAKLSKWFIRIPLMMTPILLYIFVSAFPVVISPCIAHFPRFYAKKTICIFC